MTESDLDFLSLIGSTEETSFSELCAALGEDCPRDKDGWRELFNQIRRLEQSEHIGVIRTAGKIDGIILTESGASLIRDRLDAKRGLLSIVE